jgi:hypothetical protein
MTGATVPPGAPCRAAPDDGPCGDRPAAPALRRAALRRRRFLGATLGLGAGAGAARAQDLAALAAPLHDQHPAAYYLEAGRLLRSGQRDAAVFIFYLGQLRFRTHLGARLGPARAAEVATFEALSESVGRPVDEYAFGDPPALVRTLDAVAAFDRRHPDRFTDAATFPEETRLAREGLARYRDGIAGRFDQIRRERAANGLENR